MKEKPLKVQILEYLYKNGGIDDFIDLKPQFNHYFLKHKRDTVLLIREFINDNLINTSTKDYRNIIQPKAKYEKLDIKAKLLTRGEDYIRRYLLSTDQTERAIPNITIEGSNYGVVDVSQSSSNSHDISNNRPQTKSPPKQKKSKLFNIIKWIAIILGAIASAIAIIKFYLSIIG